MSKLKKGYRWLSITRESIYGSVIENSLTGKRFHLNNAEPFESVEKAIAALEDFNKYHSIEDVEFTLQTVYYWHN